MRRSRSRAASNVLRCSPSFVRRDADVGSSRRLGTTGLLVVVLLVLEHGRRPRRHRRLRER
jgi:hypothetical protein